MKQMEDKSDGVKNTKENKEKQIGYDITSNMITLKEVIGKGEFGIVFKALMKKQKEETEVAVKTLRSKFYIIKLWSWIKKLNILS